MRQVTEIRNLHRKFKSYSLGKLQQTGRVQTLECGFRKIMNIVWIQILRHPAPFSLLALRHPGSYFPGWNLVDPFQRNLTCQKRLCNNDLWRLPKESLLAPHSDSEVSQLTSPTQAYTLPQSFQCLTCSMAVKMKIQQGMGS